MNFVSSCARLFTSMRGTVTTTIQPTRLTPEERGTVQKAARLCGVTMGDLMRAAALEYAALKLGTAR